VTPPEARVLRDADKPGELADEALNPVPELDTRRAPSAVSIRNLEVATGSGQARRPLIRGVSLDIGEAEIVGIVGESGSGKSLTAMAVARLLPRTLAWSADQLTVSGKELRDPTTEPPVELAMDMGIVFQDPSSCFNPALRIGTQLTETVRVHRKMSRREAENLALERLREVQVSAPERRMRQYPFQLSGGLRQRAMIAMSLMTRPKVLIADEPTTALDVTVQADVLHLLKRLNVDHRMAILFISHDVSAVSALCDRVCVMYAGRIVEELSADDLRQRRAQHPYTRALIAASPSSTSSRQQPLVALPGRPPGAEEVIAGCAFAERCPLVMDVCRTVDAALLKTEAGSAVACHAVNGLAEEGEARYVS
jgi:oligopeptide/dipeptide ABC transporter ATP-binding protein